MFLKIIKIYEAFQLEQSAQIFVLDWKTFPVMDASMKP